MYSRCTLTRQLSAAVTMKQIGRHISKEASCKVEFRPHSCLHDIDILAPEYSSRNSYMYMNYFCRTEYR